MSDDREIEPYDILRFPSRSKLVVILLRHAVFGLVFGSIESQDGVRVGIGYAMYSLLHTYLHLVWGVSEVSRTGGI